LFGLVEDITKRVGVVQRLLATMASGILAWAITGYAITDVNVWGLDWLLGFTVASVVFTAFTAEMRIPRLMWTRRSLERRLSYR
jgi:hypothetical protein